MERSIEATTTMHVGFTQAREVLLDDPGEAFAERSAIDERATRRVDMDLGVDLGAGASVHQNVVVQLGAPRFIDLALVLPVEWRASGHEQLLPTFHGELEASAVGAETRLRLTGTYTVPLGIVGRFGDGVLGRRVARRSLESLVRRLATRLESKARGRLDAASSHAGPRVVELIEQAHPEIYVG